MKNCDGKYQEKFFDFPFLIGGFSNVELSSTFYSNGVWMEISMNSAYKSDEPLIIFIVPIQYTRSGSSLSLPNGIIVFCCYSVGENE